MKQTITYGSWEGIPTVFITPGCYAWAYTNGAWKEANGADVGTKSRVVTEKEFEQLFGDLPDPPSPP